MIPTKVPALRQQGPLHVRYHALAAEERSRPSRVRMKPKPSYCMSRAIVPRNAPRCGFTRLPLFLRTISQLSLRSIEATPNGKTGISMGIIVLPGFASNYRLPGRDDIQLHTVVPALVSVPVLGLDYDGARRTPDFKVTEAGESLLGRLLHE